MPDIIRDGKGQGYLAAVDDSNRLRVAGTSETSEKTANRLGNAYNINTGVITLTDAADTPILYLKNNEEKDLLIEAIAVGFGPSTGGSSTEERQITIVRNPTTGTIISGATAVDINSNRNYGSANSLTVDAYKGATGNTMTNGDDHILLYNTGTRLFATISETLPKGTTIGIKVEPPASNTSMKVYAALICHLDGLGE
jgi:hypothetical protein